MFTKLGLPLVKGSDHLQLIKFWPSCAPGKGVCGGPKNFGSALQQPARSVCVSSERFVIHYEEALYQVYGPLPFYRAKFGCCVSYYLRGGTRSQKFYTMRLSS